METEKLAEEVRTKRLENDATDLKLRIEELAQYQRLSQMVRGNRTILTNAVLRPATQLGEAMDSSGISFSETKTPKKIAKKKKV